MIIRRYIYLTSFKYAQKIQTQRNEIRDDKEREEVCKQRAICKRLASNSKQASSSFLSPPTRVVLAGSEAGRGKLVVQIAIADCYFAVRMIVDDISSLVHRIEKNGVARRVCDERL